MIINVYEAKSLTSFDSCGEIPQQFTALTEKINALNLKKDVINVSLPFTDVHTHGAMGFDFSDASQDEMYEIDKFYRRSGVGCVLPTLVALSPENYRKQIRSIVNIIKEKDSSFVGINLEGPFINPNKKGAINDKDIVPINVDLAKELWEASEGTVKLMTVAPELDNFDELADFAQGKFTISLGHTLADYDTAIHAMKHENARHITHLFNAMNPLHHRNPSLIGAAMETPCLKEAICDGIHLNDGIIRMIFRLMSDEIVLISDSVSACGLDDGVYKLGGLDVYVKNHRATLSNGTIAGSCRSIYEQVKHLKELGISNEKILYSACELPLISVNMPYTSVADAERLNIMDKNLNLIAKTGY